jgi:hypothetical protein
MSSKQQGPPGQAPTSWNKLTKELENAMKSWTEVTERVTRSKTTNSGTQAPSEPDLKKQKDLERLLGELKRKIEELSN